MTPESIPQSNSDSSDSESPVSVLIVEDHEFTRMGLKLSLEQLSGLKIVGEAADGQEGVEKTRELKPQVVLMDIEMPVMDGIEATRAIKELNLGVSIIMLTSHKSDQTIFAALSAGANGYCLKNITASQLAAVIRTVASGAAWLDPGIANRVLSAYAGNLAISSPQAVPSVQQQSPQPAAKQKSSLSLSPRETEVLRLVADGLSNQKIAERLGLGLETVKTHMRHIMEKLAVSDRTEAAVKAMKQGIV
jgi:two-component system, NarL family, response regulator LiaR